MNAAGEVAETLCFKVPMESPTDVSGLAQLMSEGLVKADEVKAVIAKTEGNGRVNDFSRPLSTRAFLDLLAESLGEPRQEIAGRVAMVMSGGCEGVMSPHALILARRRGTATGATPRPAGAGKRLSVGVAFTRDLLPEEVGSFTQLDLVAEAVRTACADAGIEGLDDVGYVQVKCPLLTPERIAEADARGKQIVTRDTYRSMSLSNGACALGVATALGEVDRADLVEQDLGANGDIYSEVASCSSGIELMNCEVVVLGNSASATSAHRIGRAVLRHMVDADAVVDALRESGLVFDGLPDDDGLARVVTVLAKAGVPWDSNVLGKRTTLLSDTDLGTRPARAVTSAVIAGVVKDPAIYVSAGLVCHQGPVGGGVVAAITGVS